MPHPTELGTAHFIQPHHLPALVIAIIVSAYWWRVARMAIKMRRKTGRAANFIPAERTGRWLRWVWQPVVFVWIVLPWWIALYGHGPWFIQPLREPLALAWLGAIGAITAFVLTRICWRAMGRHWRMGIDPAERPPLLCQGPFAVVRHPIYALSSVMMLSSIAAVPAPLLIGVAGIHLLLLQWEARREERFLANLHGQPYQQYLGRVGRFTPKLFRRSTSRSAEVSRT